MDDCFSSFEPATPSEVCCATIASLRQVGFDRGSEAEIAGALARCLVRDLQSLVFSEGQFWSFWKDYWKPLNRNDLARAVRDLDGAEINPLARKGSVLKLGSNSIRGILSLLETELEAPDFFAKPASGIPCRSGLITCDGAGVVKIEPNTAKHRRRFVIDADFDLHSPMWPEETSLLHRVLNDPFRDDHDREAKIFAMAETLGAAAAGIATKLVHPKAIILHGSSAHNGKSTLANLVRYLLPRHAISSISPAQMADERHVIGLAGVAANICDEVGGASIAGESLKKAVTGDTLSGRAVYAAPTTFTPSAINIFTTNSLPSFQGGMDQGLFRRLLVIGFNRKIPQADAVPDIGKRIAESELDVLLGFAVTGAQRLARQRTFTIPPSSADALMAWMKQEPIHAWAADRLEAVPLGTKPDGGWTHCRDFYDDFKRWSKEFGGSGGYVPPLNRFTDKMRGLDTVDDVRRISTGPVAVGVRLRASCSS